jgi:flagellar biosynthesis/type III secretory pathway protein FliH
MDYEIEKKRFSDYANALETAWDKGRKETLAEVFSLLRKGYSLEEAEKMLSVKA